MSVSRAMLYGALALTLLAGSGACRRRRHNPRIWLHYDYMVASNHDHAPSPAAIQLVVDAFRRHGFDLMIDPVHNAIPESLVTVFDVPGSPWISFDPNWVGPDAVSFVQLKSQYFHPKFNADWHYVIFCHFHTTDTAAHALNFPPDADGNLPNVASTGLAALPGNDLVVAMANLDHPGWLEIETLNILPGSKAPDYAVAATFMHELGHNFGLRHGGDSNGPNSKPNYVSVMNYAYGGQGQPILTFSSTTPSGFSWRLDYSDETLPGLNELNLDETIGVQSAHTDDVILWFVPGPAQLTGPALGPIDWNNDGDSTDAGLGIDLNNDGGQTLLTGFDDWAVIRQRVGSPP